jgi:2-polyprenyl-6-methoxyphenol hydroxylase-like FAD-dependent oxidoreductase
MHWSDLHRILYESLPPGVVHMGHHVTAFEQLPGGSRVRVTVQRRAGAKTNQEAANGKLNGKNQGGGAAGIYISADSSQRAGEGAEGGEEAALYFDGDLLVAADGNMSYTRQAFLPGNKRRCGDFETLWGGGCT